MKKEQKQSQLPKKEFGDYLIGKDEFISGKTIG